MSDAKAPAPPPAAKGGGISTDRVKSFLGWAFVISIVIHAVTLPFFGLKAQQQQKQEVEKVSVTKKVTVKPPTPPPPTPTPPPPTPPPKSTPPPVKQTNPPPQPKLKLNVVKTTSKTGDNSDSKYVAPAVGNENGNPQGTEASGKPAPPAPVAATPAPTPVPTPTPPPKPACAVPNADASIKGEAVPPEFPDIAKEQGASGTAQVKVTLDAAGNGVGFEIYKSAGNAALDNSALAAAKQTKYNAEVVNCVPTAGSYLFRADFDAQ